MFYPLCNSSYIFRVIQHRFEWMILWLSQYLPSLFSSVGTGHDHVLGILGRISRLASWAVYSGNISSVQIKLSPVCSLLVCVTMLHWALFRILWILMGVPLEFVFVLPAFSSVKKFAAIQILRSAVAWWLVVFLAVSLVRAHFHSLNAATFPAAPCLTLVSISSHSWPHSAR